MQDKTSLSASPEKDKGVNLDKIYGRRTFIDYIINSGFFLAIAGTMYPLFSYFWPSETIQMTGSGRLTLPLGELPVGASKKVGFMGDTVIVVRVNESEVHALSAACTHLGCLVTWKKEAHRLVCPCHVAKFDLHGAVTGGPAPSPLRVYKARISGDHVFVEA
jgi:Rieske Fe-S protein